MSLGKKRTFIDLFAGCGGLSLGLMQAEWQGLFGIERQPDAFATLKANLHSGARAGREAYQYKWPRWLESKPWDIGELLRVHPEDLKGMRGKVDLVCGGPPCQGFSYSGKRQSSDPRNQLFRQYVKFVKLVQPRVILLENVPGFGVEHGKAARLRSGRATKATSYAQKLRGLLKEDYHLDDTSVDAVNFGVPQVRPRYFAVGIRKDRAGSSFPEGPWSRALIDGRRADLFKRWGLKPGKRTTTGEALRDLAEPHAKRGDYIPDPDGTCRSPSGFKQIEYKNAPKKLSDYTKLMRRGMNGESPSSTRLPNHGPTVRKRFKKILEMEQCEKGRKLDDSIRKHLGLKKLRTIPLHPDKPALTVTTLPDDFIHYKEPRTLTVRECARLQSFPDWFEFRGKFTTGGQLRKVECPRYTQVGNAVPPLVAQAWGEALKPMLERGWRPNS